MIFCNETKKSMKYDSRIQSSIKIHYSQCVLLQLKEVLIYCKILYFYNFFGCYSSNNKFYKTIYFSAIFLIQFINFSLFIFRCEKAELDEMKDELEDVRDCGIGGCRPAFFQPLANIKVTMYFQMLVIFSLNFYFFLYHKTNIFSFCFHRFSSFYCQCW